MSPTEYTSMRSIDGKGIAHDDFEECAECGARMAWNNSARAGHLATAHPTTEGGRSLLRANTKRGYGVDPDNREYRLFRDTIIAIETEAKAKALKDRHWLPPAQIARLRSIETAARNAVDGYFGGYHTAEHSVTMMKRLRDAVTSKWGADSDDD